MQCIPVTAQRTQDNQRSVVLSQNLHHFSSMTFQHKNYYCTRKIIGWFNVPPAQKCYIDAAGSQSNWLKLRTADGNTMRLPLGGHLPIISTGLDDIPTHPISEHAYFIKPSNAQRSCTWTLHYRTCKKHTFDDLNECYYVLGSTPVD